MIREIASKSILTKSNLPVAGFSANPYVGCAHKCQYCYASFMKRFTNHPEPWGDFVDVKYWPVLKKTQKYAGKEIFIGSVTDPYQPLEAKYGRTRALLEELQNSEARISITTKSDLVLRDLELIKSFSQVRVAWSINTLDENFRQDMDLAVSIERRLEAMRQFYEAGIVTICFISPIFPEITNIRHILRAVTGRCNLVWLENLNLRGDYKAKILNYIKYKYPHLLDLYRDIYVKGDRGYWIMLDSLLKDYSEKNGLTYLVNEDAIPAPFGKPPVLVNYFYHSEITR
ncbi:radical SAM protein [bacterium]|nr:radical SAM protein [bacterium]